MRYRYQSKQDKNRKKKQRNLAQAGRQVRIAGAFLLLIMLLLLSLIWSVLFRQCIGSDHGIFTGTAGA